MHIDFHYGVIYVVARLAGMDARRAEIVAHACQYVDDAASTEVWEFARGNLAAFESRAHRAEYRTQNPLSWPAFHFIPGAEGRKFEERVICKANSPLAVEAVERAIEDRVADIGLHRLVVALHSYVDTLAHQQFSGIVSAHNVVFFLEGEDREPTAWAARAQSALNTAGATAAALALNLVSRLGHGSALYFPDMPWMKWSYRNFYNQRIERDNLVEFMTAADMACRAIRGYLKGNVRFQNEPGLSADDHAALKALLRTNRERNRHRRYAAFERDVASGKIPGLRETIPPYSASGPDSWEQIARDIVRGHYDNGMPYHRRELLAESNHRRVLAAILQHRQDLINEILPAHDIAFA
jgi:hypothetical protein